MGSAELAAEEPVLPSSAADPSGKLHFLQRSILRLSRLRRGTASAIPEAVKPRPGDLQIEKATANIFLGTNFELIMRKRGVKSLIFTGIATEMGVELSARDAAARGFYPVIVTDCVSSMNKDGHDRSLTNLARLTTLASSRETLACY